jgi:hypothetical protein
VVDPVGFNDKGCEDPKVYTKSFCIKFTELLQPDSDVTEYLCNENEKDQSRIKK